LLLEERKRLFRDSCHSQKAASTSISQISRDDDVSEPLPYIFSAIEEFNRPLVAVDRLEDRADRDTEPQGEKPNEIPSFRSTCPPADNALEDADISLEDMEAKVRKP